jgi:hypothetical protein
MSCFAGRPQLIDALQISSGQEQKTSTLKLDSSETATATKVVSVAPQRQAAATIGAS